MARLKIFVLWTKLLDFFGLGDNLIVRAKIKTQ
jgi:hypothetical protein